MSTNGQQGLILKYSEWIIIGIYVLIVFVISTLFYFLLPILMSYPENFKKATEIVGLSYNLQFVIVTTFAVLLGIVFIVFNFRGFNDWQRNKESYSEKKLDEIRKKCINFPLSIFITQISLFILPTIMMLIIFREKISAPLHLYIKLFSVLFSIVTFIAAFTHMLIKPIFTKILSCTFKEQGLQGIRIDLKYKVFFQIGPMFMVSIIIISLLGYNNLLVEKGDLLYLICNQSLSEELNKSIHLKSTDDIMKKLEQIEVEGITLTPFVVLPNGKLFTRSEEDKISKYFIYYIEHSLKGNRAFGDTIEEQGVFKKIVMNQESYIVGLNYHVYTRINMLFFLGITIALLLISICGLYLYSKSLVDDMKRVSNGLIEIAASEVNLYKKLPITSNDELADLVIAFNKTQEKIKRAMERTYKDQEVIIEQERLAYLGQLIGGLAENFKLPLSSIDEGIIGLNCIILDYKGMLEENNLVKAEHEQLVEGMVAWIEKIKPYNRYMTEIMSAIKSQLSVPYTSIYKYFTLEELSKRVEILVDHQLRTYNCKIVKKLDVDFNTSIHGEISYLVQIINNIFVNSIYAYGNLGGEIVFEMQQDKDDVYISITDFGCGIHQEIKDKIFKSVVTTKGEDATGLGLYISYSKVKGKFKGEMWIESEVNKGTTVHIRLPIINQFLVG